MKKINVLEPKIANMIAAGEVVERPASVVKELVENAIDAGAQAITVEIKSGGISYIRVTDNGSGIDMDDTVVAFERHATSKIKEADDLNQIYTLGFRGEALSSIAAVSNVELITKTIDAEEGAHIVVQAGKLLKQETIGCPQGTTIIVRNLFFNTPARMKFLKKDATEAGYIADIIERTILGHPEISFRLINNGKEEVFTSGDNNLLNCVYSLYGKEYAKSMVKVSHESEGIKVWGLSGKPDTSRANRSLQSFFINGRYIKSKMLTYAVDEAYRNLLTVNKYPVVVLHLEVSPAFVDVNVHPTKMEVKFSNDKIVYQALYWGLKNALYAQPAIPELKLPSKNIFQFPVEYEAEKSSPVQGDRQEKLPHNVTFAKPDNPIRYTSPEPPKEVIRPNTQQAFSFKETVPPVIIDNKTGAENTKDSSWGDNRIEAVYNQAVEAKTKELTVKEESNLEQVILDKDKVNIPDFKIVGQIFNTYIVVEKDQEMLLIDQHAAHERLRYEQLLIAFKNKEIHPQTLLVPVIVQLSRIEMEIFKENYDFFARIGFEAEDFGNNSVMVRHTPEAIPEQNIKDLFLDMIGILKDSKNEAISDTEFHALYTVACKSAIKAHRTMHVREMEKLVEDLMGLSNINTCPHGRPIILSLTNYQMEKQFKRIM